MLCHRCSIPLEPLEAIAEGKIDVTDVYSTDGDIEKYDLVLLNDDRAYFPEYLAAPLVRDGLDARVITALNQLAGRLDEDGMRSLNAEVLLEGKSFAEVASAFLVARGTVHFNVSRLGDRVLTLPAPGRGNCKVYAAKD